MVCPKRPKGIGSARRNSPRSKQLRAACNCSSEICPSRLEYSRTLMVDSLDILHHGAAAAINQNCIARYIPSQRTAYKGTQGSNILRRTEATHRVQAYDLRPFGGRVWKFIEPGFRERCVNEAWRDTNRTDVCSPFNCHGLHHRHQPSLCNIIWKRVRQSIERVIGSDDDNNRCTGLIEIRLCRLRHVPVRGKV